MKKHLRHASACFVFLFILHPGAFAQWYNNDSSYNAGGLITDWMQQAINWRNGFYSTAGSTGGVNQFGVFEHYGQSGLGNAAAFINNGRYDASANGVDYFYGPSGNSGQQAIGGTTAPIFGELYLNNGTSSPFNITNASGASVATVVYFNNGITTTERNAASAGALRFLPGARYTGIVTTDASGDGRYVDGYVSSIGNSSFTFPVGQSGIQALTVTGMPSLTQLSVAYFGSDANNTPDPSDGFSPHPRSRMRTPIAAVSAAGFWDWIQSGESSGRVSVSVNIPDESAFAIASDLRLVGWNGYEWINLSRNSGATSAARFGIITGEVDLSAGITAIGIGSITYTTLPVTLVSFEGKVDKTCVAHLRWLATNEQNIRDYSVEISYDGLRFTPIGKVAAKNTVAQSAYAFDYKDLRGAVFARLTIEENGGVSRYSNAINLRSTCGAGTVEVLPNPAVNTVQVRGLSGGANTLLLLTVAGTQVRKVTTNAKAQTLDVSGLAAGSYLLKIINATGASTTVTFEKM